MDMSYLLRRAAELERRNVESINERDYLELLQITFAAFHYVRDSPRDVALRAYDALGPPALRTLKKEYSDADAEELKRMLNQRFAERESLDKRLSLVKQCLESEVNDPDGLWSSFGMLAHKSSIFRSIRAHARLIYAILHP